MNRDIQAFHTRLLNWYAAHGRQALPWRSTSDPYAIWVSEIMLQQTQVDTVLKRFYFPFLERFPTLAALALASRQDVLKAWEGLGYYSRAVNLHEAAKRASPALPRSVEELLTLPGVGRNTAHAVTAFAYHTPVPVMEANVKRVLCRIFALETPTEKELWARAEELLDRAHPFDYNQAMMDIGSAICTKSKPACLMCPAHDICAGKTNPKAYPAPKAKKQTPVRKRAILVLRDPKGRIYAIPRQGRFLHGLYQFVEIPVAPAQAGAHASHPRENKWETWIPACAGMTGKTAREDFTFISLGHITQTYSHFTLEADVYVLNLEKEENGQHWHAPEVIPTLPWSKAEQKILALLETLSPRRMVG